MFRNLTVQKRLMLFVGVLACIAAASAEAAKLGDPKTGQVYAQTHCAGCHSISRGGSESAVAAATPFQMIADTGGITRTALYVFFRTPHPTMPNLIVKDDDLDNVIAYILSLKTDKP